MAFEWFRSWHGAPTDSKFLLIAKRAQVAPGMVSAVYWALLDYASQNEPRGNAEGFDTETYAEWAGWDERDVVAIIAALTNKGAIVDGKITAWEKRQPKKEDPSAAERQQRKRERDKQLVTEDTDVVTQRHAVSRSVTTDQIRSEDDDIAAQRRKAIEAIQQFGLFNASMLAQFDDMWPELVQERRLCWIDDAVRVARAKNASTPQYALKVLANAIHTGKAPGYVNGESHDADTRPRVPAPSKEDQAAADARQAEYERQIAEQLARAGKL